MQQATPHTYKGEHMIEVDGALFIAMTAYKQKILNPLEGIIS